MCEKKLIYDLQLSKDVTESSFYKLMYAWRRVCK